MTEREWMECSDPIAMLLFLFGPFEKLTEDVWFSRKNLLLVCACWFRLGDLIPSKARLWAEHAALAAEGCYDKRKLHGEEEEADCECLFAMNHTTEEGRGRLGALIELWTWTGHPEPPWDGSEPFWEAERKEQAALIRDIYGNPFRAVTVNPAWLSWQDVTIPKLAEAIYADRAFDHLPILADALEEAGCTDADILNHCRQPGEHVRGCWVVDLILGKS